MLRAIVAPKSQPADRTTLLSQMLGEFQLKCRLAASLRPHDRGVIGKLMQAKAHEVPIRVQKAISNGIDTLCPEWIVLWFHNGALRAYGQ